jgi:restriction system protein
MPAPPKQIPWDDIIWKAFKPLLPYLALAFAALVAYGLVLSAIAKARRRKLLSLGIEDIDQLHGRDFERLLHAIYAAKGYRVEATPYCGDWGADLVVSKDGIRTVVQAKRWKKRVGVRAVQEVVAAKGKYRAQEATVVTNSTYTQRAYELAKANRVRLWDRARLLKELEALPDR